jgi:ABC-type antimicrobial peptide transport system permease subunit
MPQVVPIDPTVEPGARRTMALVLRTAGPPAAAVAAVRRIVRDLDPTVPIFNVEAMSDVVRASTARLSLALALMTAAAAITLLLGTIGLYGVMAYMVALRTREFGVRVALGASPRQLAQAVAFRGLALIGSGVAAGLVLYAIASPFLRSFLYGVTASDPVTLTGVTLVLVGTASLASWLPARRAAHVDPAEALRAE